MFINLTWVFFRATSFEDAWKVLKGMSGVSGVVLHPMFETRLGFLATYGVEFQGMFENISGNRWIVLQIFVALILVLVFKNSNEKVETIRFTLRSATFVSLVFSFGVLSLTRVSEFLYFNF
jgi:hypothetical protein